MMVWMLMGLIGAALMKYAYSVAGADIHDEEVSDWLYVLTVFDFVVLLIGVIGGPITLCIGATGTVVATFVYMLDNGLPDILSASVVDFRKKED